MSDVFVKSFTHLKDRPKADRALPMLQRVASLVKPIMRKRGWVLPVLAEFFPDSPILVGGHFSIRKLYIHTHLLSLVLYLPGLSEFVLPQRFCQN